MRAALARNGSLMAMVLRAAIWRKTQLPPLLGLGDFVLWCLVCLSVELVASFLGAGAAPHFDPYGLNALVAWRATMLLVGVAFVPPPYRATILGASLALSSAVSVAMAATPFALSLLPIAKLEKVWGFEARHSGGALMLLYLVWWMGATLALFRGVISAGRVRLFARAGGYVLAAVLVTYLFPHLPVFEPPDFQIASANVWEAQRAAARAQARAGRPHIDAARVTLAQPALLEAAIGRLRPQRDGVTDIFTLGIAGFSREDVFIRELNGALGSLGGVLPIEGRVVRLVNHPSVLNVAPLATLQNFSAAVRAIGNVMNKNEDILLLFMTSHGSGEGFALAMEDVGFSTLRPDQVASVLDAEGIKHRIVIVSACYSGIFIPPLASDDSIVMTAADDSSASFGCSSEREWTYFGDALFNQSLHRGTTLEQAFGEARQIIAGWETQERLPPSNPQAHFGPNLVAKLQPLYLKADAPPWPSAAAWPPTAPWGALPAAKSDGSIWGKQP